jgi:aspartyl-tRNA(Asn)/glutamyl-tRNA(Gln) amidotransferase subunit C
MVAAYPQEVRLPLSREEVQHIATLARVGLSEEEIARFREQLSEILDYFQRLRQVDTDDVPPTAHTLPLQNVMREDGPQPSFPQEEVLRNAPLREDDMFSVRAILEE